MKYWWLFFSNVASSLFILTPFFIVALFENKLSKSSTVIYRGWFGKPIIYFLQYRKSGQRKSKIENKSKNATRAQPSKILRSHMFCILIYLLYFKSLENTEHTAVSNVTSDILRIPIMSLINPKLIIFKLIIDKKTEVMMKDKM